MKITICGAGNAAQTLIALLAANHRTYVAVYAPLADESLRLRTAAQAEGVTATFPGGQRYCGRPALVTTDAAAAGADADLLLLALPAFAHEAVLRAAAQSKDVVEQVEALLDGVRPHHHRTLHEA